jgi:hypothetical protein
MEVVVQKKVPGGQVSVDDALQMKMTNTDGSF